MTAVTPLPTRPFDDSTDSLLRFAMRLDATLSGLVGLFIALLADSLSALTGLSSVAEFSGGALLVLGGLPRWRWLRASPPPVAWTLAGALSFAGTALVYGLLGAMLLSAASGRRPVGGDASRRGRLGAVAAAALAIVAAPVLLWWICAFWMLDTVSFDQRVRAFDSGLSPLVSLAWLVAALYCWVLLELQRRRLTNWQQIDWPLAEEYDPAFRGCGALLGAIRRLLAAVAPVMREPGAGKSFARTTLAARLPAAPSVSLAN